MKKKYAIALIVVIILFSGCSIDKIFNIGSENKDLVSSEGGVAAADGGYIIFTRNGPQSGMGVVDAKTGSVKNVYNGNYRTAGLAENKLFYSVTDKNSRGMYCYNIKADKFLLKTKSYIFASSPVCTDDGSTTAFLGCAGVSNNSDLYCMDVNDCIPKKIDIKNENIIDLSFGKNKELIYSKQVFDKNIAKYIYQMFKYSPVDMKESRLRISSDNEVTPVLSPDGKKLAFISDKYVDYNLFIMDLQSGAVDMIGKSNSIGSKNDAIVGGTIKWTKDSKYLCYVRLKGAAAYSVKTADVERKTTYDISEGYNICFSPSGKEVVYARYDPKKKKQVVCIKGIKGEKGRLLFEYPEESRYSRSIDMLKWIKQ